MSDYERFALPADHYDDPVARGEAEPEPEPLATRYLRLYVAVRDAVTELNSEGWIHGGSPVAATLRDAIGRPDPMAPPPGPTGDRSPSDG